MAGNAAVGVDVDSSIFHLYDSSQSVLPAADAYAELPPLSSIEISDRKIIGKVTVTFCVVNRTGPPQMVTVTCLPLFQTLFDCADFGDELRVVVEDCAVRQIRFN